MKKYFLAVLSLCVVAMGLFYWQTDNYQQNKNTPAIKPAVNSMQPGVQEHIPEESLSTDIFQDNEKLNAKKIEPENIPPLTSENALNQNPDMESLYTFLTNFPSEIAMASYFQEEFNNENVDYYWVNQAEGNIASTFYDDIYLQEFTLGQIQCKARLCQVQMNLGNDEHNAALMEILGEKFKAGSMHFAYAVIAKHSPENRQYLYFVRKREG